MNPELPQPDADARAHSDRLSQRITETIAATGGLRFDQYCQMALYEPGLGYYAAGSEKFGVAGDFVTAPELGDVFARCMAAPVAHTLEQLGQGDVLELGAGTGAMAADLLRELLSRDALPEHYRILEVSAELRERQRQTLLDKAPDLIGRVEWLDTLPTTPWRGVVLANEVVDALPARRFQRDENGWTECLVVNSEDGLGWGEAEVDAWAADHLARIESELEGELPVGYCTELQLDLPAWVGAVAGQLESGRLILVDYGYPRSEYFLPERTDGTLICHYRHRAHTDPFLWPGLNDISVNVEFTALAEALAAAGFDVDGLSAQAQFLIGCGLGAIVGESTEDVTKERVNLIQQVQMLTRPGEMGERFLVLTGARGVEVEGPAPGFQVENRLDRL